MARSKSKKNRRPGPAARPPATRPTPEPAPAEPADPGPPGGRRDAMIVRVSPVTVLLRLARGWKVVLVLVPAAYLVAVTGTAVARGGALRIAVLGVLGVALLVAGAFTTPDPTSSSVHESTVRIDLLILLGWILTIATVLAVAIVAFT